MKVLVIIVSYNFERWIDRCLGSLRQSELQADVVVIDNASQDRTVQLIESRYPEVRLVKSETNLGFGRANNIGMEIALREGYDYVFLLNQDAWISPQVLGTLTRLAEANPQYGILSPTHLAGNGKELEPGFAAYIKAPLNPPKGGTLDESYKSYKSHKTQTESSPFGIALPRQTGEPGGGVEGAVISLPFLNAAFWLIPIAVLRKVGGFSPLFYHYGEDVDFVNRLHYHGYLVGYMPTVFGCHDREHRQVTRAAWLRSEEVYLLSEYANINRSFPEAFAYGVLAGIKKAWKALLRRDLSTCSAYLKMSFRLMGRTRAVISNRKLNGQ